MELDDESWKFALAAAIKAARSARNVTQEELARRVGRSVRTVSRFETAEREPSAREVRAIAQALDMNVSALYTTADALDAGPGGRS